MPILLNLHLSQNLKPADLVSVLNKIFSEFDDLSLKYGIEKIKTIGDNYFSVSGLAVTQRIQRQVWLKWH